MRRLADLLRWLWWTLRPPQPPEPERPGDDGQFSSWPAVRPGSVNPQKAADQREAGNEQ